MAATSTWALGTHKMTADMSSSTPVANPSTESPIKAKSFGMIEGSTMPSPPNGTTPVAPASAASTVTTNHNTNTASATASNGVERVPVSAGEVGATEEDEEEASEVAAGTSSDSGDEEEEEERSRGRGGSDTTGATTAPTASAVTEGNAEIKLGGGGGAEKGKRVEQQQEGGGLSRTQGESLAKQEAITGNDSAKAGDASEGHGPKERNGWGTEPKEEHTERDPAKSKERTEACPTKKEPASANGHAPVGSNGGADGGKGHPAAATAAAAAVAAIAAATAAPAVARSASLAPAPAASASPRQEVDEHAARASDAATAALAAALASATRSSPPSRPVRSPPLPSKSPVSSHQQATKAEERSLGASRAGAAAAGGLGGGSGGRHPAVMLFRAPRGRDFQQEVSEADVERALSSARYFPERSSSAWGGAEAIPPPLPLPTVPIPCMVGHFKVDETTGVHRCVGSWAMNKADLRAADKNRASPFEFKMVEGSGGAAVPFPHSGKYQGHFLVRQAPKPVSKVEEKDLQIAFVKNSEGGWNVEGQGHNVYGAFTITGRLDANRQLEVYRAYQKIPKAHHRRASGTVAAAAAKKPAGGGSAAAAAAPALHGPNRGKHFAPAAAAAGGAGYANGGVAAKDAGPVSRRVSRTPSKLINDIGNDGTTHLTHGLRRCVTVLNNLRAIRGKSEWFNEPVDYVGLNLPEYTTIIKRPMDLGTVKAKLEGGEYKNTVEFAHQVRLVFSNACHYNSDETSAVHIAARQLLHIFEAKMEELGPNLDDPPSKRKKSSGGGGGGSSSNHHHYSSSAGGASTYADSDDSEEETFDRDRKRKSSDGGNASGGRGGGGSTSKKPRAPSSAKAFSQPKVEPPVPVAVAPPPPAPPAGGVAAVSDPQREEQVLMMQRQITQMQEQLAMMQGGVTVPQPNTEPPPRQPSAGSKRKSKGGNGKASGGSSKGGAKSAKGGGGGGGARRGGGGGGRAAPNPAKAAADKAAKAAAKARKNAEDKKRKAEEAARAAEALAAAQNPLTFDEKKALSVAINNLDQSNLTRVVEIIQARMPLGSSDEEIELDIDSMDNLTLRDLQAFIKDVSDKDGGRRGGGGVDSDSDGEQW